jgi:hypothetical protein
MYNCHFITLSRFVSVSFVCDNRSAAVLTSLSNFCDVPTQHYTCAEHTEPVLSRDGSFSRIAFIEAKGFIA